MAIQTPLGQPEDATSTSWWARRKAGRRRRREIQAAVRGEWELEPRLHGWAAVRAFAKQVGELEQARLVAHAEAAGRTPIPRPADADRSGGSLDDAPPQRAKRA